MKRISAIILMAVSILTGCKVPSIPVTPAVRMVPSTFNGSVDTSNTATLSWRSYFTDTDLVTLIDTALAANQELLITLQEIEIARNDIRFRKGALLPSVTAGAGIGVEKVGRYTSQGAGDATTEIKPGKEMPDPLMDYRLAVTASWEADIWKKLHNAKKAAVMRYMATVEGKNFITTNLIAEVASSYYELQALDNQLAIVKQNIQLQQNALGIVRVQKEAARTTELAVQKFEAEVMKSQSLEFDILQDIQATENRINLLLGRYPQSVHRSAASFVENVLPVIQPGIPSQLLVNRPDIRQAELELQAAKLDVKVARAEFFPSFGITASFGLQAFNPAYLVKFPESVLYSLAADVAGPLINRNAIRAEFNNASSRQLQALYDYERTVLNAYLQISTRVASIDNLGQRFAFRTKQVDALTRSIDISNDLFRSARVDYFEVLMTQRDALEAKLELIETRKMQLEAVVGLYRELGGGWK